MSRAFRESPAAPFFISLLLHGLVFGLIVTGIASPAGRNRAAALLREPEILNFQLVDVPPGPAARPDEPTPRLAERDARAADRGPRELPVDEAYQRGLTAIPSAEAGEGGRGERGGTRAGRPAAAPATATPPAAARTAPAPRPSPADASSGASAAAQAPATATPRTETPELLAQGRSRDLGDRRLELPRPEVSLPPVGGVGDRARGLPQVDNRLTRARYEGDFSLSTYAWDYAPYMRRLKKQLEDYTWTILPTAFWYGIAAWATQVRFVILPDGTLESVIISGHDGVLELRHVAPDAVTGAARYEPLPPGFPEEKLTITGNFYFNVFPPSQGARRDEAGPDGRGAGGP